MRLGPSGTEITDWASATGMVLLTTGDGLATA
jgi:hypothetical protein